METIKLPLFVAVLALFVAFANAAITPAKPGIASAPAAVDVGEKYIVTCTKDATDKFTGAISYKFYSDAGKAKEITGGADATAGTLTTTPTAATSATIYCAALDVASVGVVSDLVTVKVSALKAPTISSVPKATAGKLTVASGTEVKFTCNKDPANNAAKEYKFMVGTTAATPAAVGAVYTGKALKVADKMKVKCTFYNTDAAQIDSSNDILLDVTGDDPAGTGSAVTHLVSLTTMGLFLVLGAIFRE